MKYTDELVNTLVKSIETGLSIKKACDYVGISQKTFYQWVNEKSEFSNKIKKARATKINNLLEQIRISGMGETTVECPHCKEKHVVKLPSKAWQALAWILERT